MRPSAILSARRVTSSAAKGLLVALTLVPVASAHAQRIETRRPWPGQWLTSYVPFVATLPNDGPSLELRARHWQMADYDDRVTASVAWSARAAWSPWGGSWLGSLGVNAPRRARGWRLAAELQGGRAARFGYYGLGNTTGIDPDLADGSQRYLYRVKRNLYSLTGDITRQIAGPLGISLMLQGAGARYRALPGPSLFQQGDEFDEWEGSGRLALVLDLRDKEYDTRKGIVAEGGYQLGVSNGDNYRRWYGAFRAWVPPTSSTVIAARAFASDLSGRPTLLARELIPAWEQPFSVLGGEDSHRALPFGRFAGTGVLGANLELRQMIWSRRDIGGVGLLGFVDAGRAFEGAKLELTFDNWTVGYGGGIVLKALRGNIFVFTVGWTKEESHIGFRTGWMF